MKTAEELRAYNREKLREWRLKNPEKNKQSRIRYKKSEKGKLANKAYHKRRYPEGIRYDREKYLKKYAANPEKFKQRKSYINNYLKSYMLDAENHRKYLVRQKDQSVRRKLLKQIGFCQLCGSQKDLEIHHKTYEEKNVILLCRSCHRRLHWKDLNSNGRYKNGRVQR